MDRAGRLTQLELEPQLHLCRLELCSFVVDELCASDIEVDPMTWLLSCCTVVDSQIWVEVLLRFT